MRAYEKPGQQNPYAVSLVMLGIFSLVAGAGVTFGVEEDFAVIVGTVLMNLGGLLIAGWLVAGAILWRPAEERETV